MKTKKTLSCYVFSNLFVSIFCFNFLFTNHSIETIEISNNELNTLRKIYEIKVELPKDEVSVTNDVYTVSVTKKNVSSKNVQYVKPSYNSVTGKNIVNYAKHYLGLRYVSGGNSLTEGTDCSGFTKLIYKEFGINLGRTVSSQTYSGQYVKKSDLQPGDLVFYGYTNYATHVGIYMGDGLVIHQSNPRDGVKINSVDMMVYITARRVITENIVSEEKDISEDLISENKENDTNVKVPSNLEEENNVQNQVSDDTIKSESVDNNPSLKEDEVDTNLEQIENDTQTESKIEDDTSIEEKEEVEKIENDFKDQVSLENNDNSLLSKDSVESTETNDSEIENEILNDSEIEISSK